MFRFFIFIIIFVISSAAQAVDGFLEPVAEVEISTPETGVIIKSNAKEGQVISKGELLAELDSSVLRASLTGASADYKDKKRKQSELETLFDQQIASFEELEEAKTQTLIALSQYQTLQRQVSRRKITSPIDGVITEVAKEVGELVSQGQGPFIKIINISQLKLVVFIPYEQTVELQKDQLLSIKINSVDDLQSAKINYISPVVDPASSTVKVELLIQNEQGQFRSGVPASVQL